MTLPLLRPIVRVIIVAIVACAGLAAAPGIALAQSPPETIEYYATDGLGSVRVVFTPAGEVIGRSDYLPFGDTLEQSGMLPRQRFTGQERDGVAGLDDFNARSLQMRTGRMSSPDPLFGDALVNPQRWNRYAYVQNNPLKYTDPTGMDAYDNDAGVRAANEFAQSFWGLQAWDDFSREPWAIAWGYSYGPFSPRDLYNSAFTPRDNGGGSDVTTSYYISVPGLLPSRPLALVANGVLAPAPEIKSQPATPFEVSVILPRLFELYGLTMSAVKGGVEWSCWQCKGESTPRGPYPGTHNRAAPIVCPDASPLVWAAHSHTSPSPPSPLNDYAVSGAYPPTVNWYSTNTAGEYYKYSGWTNTTVLLVVRW